MGHALRTRYTSGFVRIGSLAIEEVLVPLTNFDYDNGGLASQSLYKSNQFFCCFGNFKTLSIGVIFLMKKVEYKIVDKNHRLEKQQTEDIFQNTMAMVWFFNLPQEFLSDSHSQTKIHH